VRTRLAVRCLGWRTRFRTGRVPGMLLVLDNYDSFTYNLVQYAGELGADPVVYRNDAISPAEVLALRPDAIIISPGPCTPREAGISVPLIRAAAGVVPILGVCLGHQAIGEAFGGRVVRAERLMHGKTTWVSHTNHPLFQDIPSPLEAMRYHSLLVSPEGLPPDLEVTAWSADRPEGSEIMALSHRSFPIHGVQFHPESVATSQGKQLLANFLSLAKIRRAPPRTITV
jgi:anthranilate synthase/aminodeoxychorismate synthase-like glutamine amidotransferase